HAEQIEIFPGGGQDAFADRLARMPNLVDQQDMVAHAREPGGRATAGRSAADYDDIGLRRDPQNPLPKYHRAGAVCAAIKPERRLSQGGCATDLPSLPPPPGC